MYKNHIKRGLDIIISTCVLLVLWPVFLITAIAIKLDSKGPIIFKQVRLGKDHKKFNMYIFRSMVVNAEHTGSGVYSGTVERLCRKMELAGKFYGFGGIASLGRGMVPAEMIIKEHYRLGSHMAILSRSFCNINNFEELDAVEEIFYRGVREIRTLEKECGEHLKYFSDNRKELTTAVDGVVDIIRQKKAM